MTGPAPPAAAAAAVSAPVASGLFTVALGDTSLANMAAIDASVFTSPNLQLRIWFSDGVNGFAALNPVQNVTPTPYAAFANNASNVLGSIPATQLTGAVASSQLPASPVFSGTVSGNFAGNGAPARSMLNTKIVRQGRLVDQHMNVFHIETTINNRMFANPTKFLGENEDEFSEVDRLKFEGLRWTLAKLPETARRKMFEQIPSPYQMIACHAGKADPVHERIVAKGFEQYMVKVKGQSDIVIFPIPYVSPYNINSILNPILLQVMGLGYFHNFYRGKPVLRKGGALILCHPGYDEFDHAFHPSYIEFFHRLLPETRDATTLQHKYEEEFARNPSYIEMYRRGNAYHGAHPFFMWYWGENGRQHAGKVILAGAKNAHVPAIMGWDRSESLTEAIAMARSFVGPSASITMMKWPPIVMADVE